MTQPRQGIAIEPQFVFTELTPTAFLERSAAVFPERVAIIDGERSFTYREFLLRSRALAGMLRDRGIEAGDRVAALCTNSHVMLELHHGVPWCGAVIVPLNFRLALPELAYIVRHSGARLIVATHEFAEVARRLASECEVMVVVAGDLDDEYESLLTPSAPLTIPCENERTLLAINYTSGTTGTPRGVMYHHRGAYLQSLAMALQCNLSVTSRYLWTLPMFHCNGWSFTWSISAVAATHVCLRAIEPGEIWRLLRDEEITHFCAAPTVLTMIGNDAGAMGPTIDDRDIVVMTGGAPPSPTLIGSMRDLGIRVTHLYGLTETFGPLAINDWHPEWDDRTPAEQARLTARQGVGNVIADRVRVVDVEGADVPSDGETMGEILTRGNNVMLGYFRDPDATSAVSTGAWMRTGDIGVMHSDGYLEIRDRIKDIIISGGENIASVEVERVIDEHPAVMESAIIGRPDPKWGEIPVAFVCLRPGAIASEQDIIEHVRSRLARYKAPREVRFAALPKTATGKIRKADLRQQLTDESERLDV